MPGQPASGADAQMEEDAMLKMVRNLLVVAMIATVSFAGDCGDDDDNMMMQEDVTAIG